MNYNSCGTKLPLPSTKFQSTSDGNDTLWTYPYPAGYGYYNYYPYIDSKSKAFDIAKTLVEDKFIDPPSAKKFIELVDSIRKVL